MTYDINDHILGPHQPGSKKFELTRWTADDHSAIHTPLSLAVYEKTTAALSNYVNKRPRIFSITSQGHYGQYDCNVEIELWGGVLVDIEFAANHEDIPEVETLEGASEQASMLVVDIIRSINTLGFDKVASELNSARAALQKLFAQWSEANECHVYLGDVRLKFEEYWRHTLETPALMTIECLSDTLMPGKIDVEAYHPDELVSEVSKLHDNLKTITRTKIILQKNAADGIIDLVALNAMIWMEHGGENTQDYLAMLRKPFSDERFDVFRGCITYDTFEKDKLKLEWQGDVLRVHGVIIPESARRSAVGKPITDIISHPYLTDEINILKVSQYSNPNGGFLEIHFEQPKFFYCQFSGRFWPTNVDKELLDY